MGIPQFDLLSVPCQTSLVKGQQKGKYTATVVCKQTSLIVQGGTGFASPRNVFPRLDNVSIHVSGYTTAAQSVLPRTSAVAQKGFLVLVNNYFSTQCTEFHFSCSSNEQMMNQFFGWLDPCSGRIKMPAIWLILVFFTSFVKVIYLML